MSPRSDPEFFDAKYRADPDPWNFDTDWYEIRKRTLLLAMLPHPRFRSALEPGCANGHITTELARRCDRVTATDIAPRAVELTGIRCRDQPNVEVREWGLGRMWHWENIFDLVLLSEVVYYLPADALTLAIEDMASHLRPRTTVVLSHWRHTEKDHHLDGDEATGIALAAFPHRCVARYLDADVRIEVVTTNP
ncbi:class I SAM-dependent methyltransferase [Nocardia aurea]|uniref:class I SAM-dependent methyltransferase n=1 Tax=Nocardia aurea TaxID=2144174 RepID=UPI0033B1FBBE